MTTGYVKTSPDFILEVLFVAACHCSVSPVCFRRDGVITWHMHIKLGYKNRQVSGYQATLYFYFPFFLYQIKHIEVVRYG